ncbi:UNVERIFIED_CONTAM: hypothetical protein O8I53_06355 [Campylobacter lari]
MTDNANLQKFNIIENDQEVSKYIVPGALKNNSKIPNLINTEIIYANSDASNFKVPFEKDKYSFSTSDDLVGKINFKYIYEALNDYGFNKISADFIEKVKNNFKTNNVTSEDLSRMKSDLLSSISEFVSDSNSPIRKYDNPKLTLFDEQSLKDKKIKNLTELKIYLITAILYYLYFTDNSSDLLKAVLINDSNDEKLVKFDSNVFNPSKIEVTLGEQIYYIGGYASYEAKQEVNDETKNVIIRYDLIPSDNYVFQTVDNVYEVKRHKQVVNKYGFIGI